MMNVTILNGSPRKGNTSKALSFFQDALKDTLYSVERFDLYEYSIKACRNCDCCLSGGTGCIHHDDSNEILSKVIKSDVIVLGTPVYYWGISAQMKLLIDKFYSVNSLLKGKKKVITIVTGANPLDDVQYELIHKQFSAICNYLLWEYITFISVSAYKPDDISFQEDAIKRIKQAVLLL